MKPYNLIRFITTFAENTEQKLPKSKQTLSFTTFPLFWLVLRNLIISDATAYIMSQSNQLLYNYLIQSFLLLQQQLMQKVLCSLTVNPDFVEFGIPQLKSLLQSCEVPLQVLLSDELKGKQFKGTYEINHEMFPHYPFIVLTVPDFEKHRSFFQNLCKQAVMLHKAILLISIGQTYNQLLQNKNESLLQQYCRNSDQQVICQFYSRNRVIQRQEQVHKIHSVLGGLDIRGHVNFKNPKLKYQLLQQHQWYQQHHKTQTSYTMKKVYFGIELSSNKVATAKFNYKYQLNKRIYLGPTSTDNDLAFLMCNQGLVTNGSIVIDPFVGTGGLLIPSASKGAIVFGSDLDIRVLNGYAVGRINKKSPFYQAQKKYEVFTPKINLNFQQYGLPFPNIIRIDATKLVFKAEQFFDAIITDPPYGIRAMSRSVTQKQAQAQQPQKEQVIQQQQDNTLAQQEQQITEKEQTQMKQGEQTKQILLTPEQLQSQALKKKKQEKRKILKQNKKKRNQLLPEQEKTFKKNLLERMNRERVENWQKFDRTKVQTTEREKIFEGLLQFSKKYLKKKGRLVFLYPIYQQQDYKGVHSLPSHAGFTVIDLSENKMSKGNSRILVTLQKE